MTCGKLLIFLYTLRLSTSDWASEWMYPVQDQFEDNLSRRSGGGNKLKLYEDEYQKMSPYLIESTENPTYLSQKANDEQATENLKLKLETSLESAKMLAELLKLEILALSAKEKTLKEVIANGRSGVSTVLVSSSGQLPRSYLIRDGLWTLCTGVIRPPALDSTANLFNGALSTPKCFGQEVPTRPDPCVFNSIIKYETIPTFRKHQYIENEYLCLKPTFNGSLEQFLSVPTRIINETCTNGIVRSLDENILECGMRVMSDYTYYPNRMASSPPIPLEYCNESDGACKLIVAWHVSNATIENFEFLKNEQNFKKYFMRTSPIEHVI